VGVSRARVGLRRACCRFLLFALSKLLNRGGARRALRLEPLLYVVKINTHLCTTICYIIKYSYGVLTFPLLLLFSLVERKQKSKKKTLKFLKTKKKTHFFLLTTSIITNSYSSRESAGVVATTQRISTTNTKRDQGVFLFSRDLFSLQARSLYLFLFVSAYLILISLAIVIELTRSVVRLSAFAYGLSIA
jgi:hypothetical protein